MAPDLEPAMHVAEVRPPLTKPVGVRCAGRIDRELLGLTGVVRASVSPARPLVRIGYDPTRVGLDDLRAAIRYVDCGVARWERAVLRIRVTEVR